MHTFKLLTRQPVDRSRAVLAEGVQFTDGHITLRWRSPRPAMITFDCLDDLLYTYGNTIDIEWLGPPAGPTRPTPHRDDGGPAAPSASRLSQAAASLGPEWQRPDDPPGGRP